VEWCWFGDERLADPFFEQTLGARMRLPFCMLLRRETTADLLLELQQMRRGLTPSGFIFHVSRCGSTLFSQVFASSRRHRVISEAPPIDEVLRCPGIAEDRRREWLGGIIHSLGEPLCGADKYFVKFDSWHALRLPLIRQAFPRVPFVFLYRDPIEVMVSHQQEPGKHMVPGLLRLGLTDLEGSGKIDLAEYQARVLAELYGALLRNAKLGPVRLLNYSELPGAAFSGISEFFGVEWTSEEKEAALATTRFHSKRRGLEFENDSLAKRNAATKRTLELVDRWIQPIYVQLEKERLNRSSGRESAP
jgi:hypothetical protein